MKIVHSWRASSGLLAAALTGLMFAGATSVASAQLQGASATPSYFQPQQASPIGAYGAYGDQPFMQVSACESSCSSHCEPSCGSMPCESSCEASCGGCGHCDDCCEDDCDSCFDPCCHVFYVGLSGGWSSRETASELGDPAVFTTFDDGCNINFVLGRTYDWVRIEAEVSRFNNEVLVTGAGALGIGPTAGSVNLTAFMFNAYHDFDIVGWRLDPYIGAGIGFAQSEINGLLPSYFAATDPAINATSDYQFAWQLRAGFNYDCSDRTTLFAGYRYFRVEDLTFSAAPFGTFNPNGGREHSIELGLRVAF